MDEFHISLIWTKNLTVFGFQRPHTSCKTVSTIIKLGFEVLEHPAYSPDLAPSDYFLFGLLKKELKASYLTQMKMSRKWCKIFFHTLPKSAYKEGIYKLPERWRRCIESQVYHDHALADRTCQKWFARFKSSNFDLEDEERSGALLKFEEARLNDDPTQTQKELAKELGVTQPAILLRLKEIGIIRRVGNWVPYELKPRGVECRFSREKLLQRPKKKNKRKGFLHQIVTDDEKWVHYDYPKRWATYGYPGRAS
ncbi:hypothetical protein LAZ67_12003585 [Cordylochernes scorpioides]|uniref:Transposase n=1 Tax=Cordylochernes scorpioides TaxID=51811 RepID=A0ABY6L2H7_9ARAC|nr:hypothetical protein LAZ67_12003585 [Cordylochernes scorpioides]